MIAVAPLAANAACFTDMEWKAAHVRVLQTELQVAALECANVQGASYNDQYTAFIGQFQDRLKANATQLKAHFQRVYGANSGHELDAFVTKVANDASSRSMQDLKFCADSADLFKTALAIDKAKFEQAAIDHVVDHLGEVGEECPVKAAVVQTAAAVKAPVKPAVAKATAKPTPATASAAAAPVATPAVATAPSSATPAAAPAPATPATAAAPAAAPKKDAAATGNAG